MEADVLFDRVDLSSKKGSHPEGGAKEGGLAMDLKEKPARSGTMVQQLPLKKSEVFGKATNASTFNPKKDKAAQKQELSTKDKIFSFFGKRPEPKSPAQEKAEQKTRQKAEKVQHESAETKTKRETTEQKEKAGEEVKGKQAQSKQKIEEQKMKAEEARTKGAEEQKEKGEKTKEAEAVSEEKIKKKEEASKEKMKEEEEKAKEKPQKVVTVTVTEFRLITLYKPQVVPTTAADSLLVEEEKEKSIFGMDKKQKGTPFGTISTKDEAIKGSSGKTGNSVLIRVNEAAIKKIEQEAHHTSKKLEKVQEEIEDLEMKNKETQSKEQVQAKERQVKRKAKDQELEHKCAQEKEKNEEEWKRQEEKEKRKKEADKQKDKEAKEKLEREKNSLVKQKKQLAGAKKELEKETEREVKHVKSKEGMTSSLQHASYMHSPLQGPQTGLVIEPVGQTTDPKILYEKSLEEMKRRVKKGEKVFTFWGFISSLLE